MLSFGKKIHTLSGSKLKKHNKPRLSEEGIFLLPVSRGSLSVEAALVLPLFLFFYFAYGFPMVIFFGVPTTAYLLAKEFNELFAQFISTQD